jgi:membrane fusion protein (multidrug efflux system)
MAEESHGTQPGNAPASSPGSPQGANEEPTDAPPLARSRPLWLRKRVLGTVFFIILAGAGTPYGMQLWQYYQTHETTDDAYVIGDIVAISARISGTVAAVHVSKHQQVESGQLLAELDPDDFAARVAQAEASVEVARARLRHAELLVLLTQDSTSNDTVRTGASLRAAQSALREAQHGAEKAEARLRTWEAAVAAAQADVDTQDVHVAMAQTGFDRMKNLLNDGVVAQQQFDQALSALQAAEAEKRAKSETLQQTREELDAAKADLSLKQEMVQGEEELVAEAQATVEGSQAQHQSVDIQEAEVKVAQALLQQAEADLAYARLQLQYTTLKAPVAGVVAKKNLEIGQVVQPGRPLLALVPLQEVWVEANFKETQLQYMRPGQRATLQVDAYPEEVFSGTVESLSPGTGAIFSLLPPENATGNFVKVVQRVPVKIRIEPSASPGVMLRPGMSVIATVNTQ